MKVCALKNCLLPIVVFLVSASSWAFSITNPAIKGCLNAGGRPDTVILEEGEMSMCEFSKVGTSAISSWALVYANSANREEGEQLPAAIQALLSEKNKIPTNYGDDWQSLAAVNCTDNLKGEVRKVVSVEGNNYTICFFPEDQSAIGTTTLLLGPDTNGPNRSLMNALKSAGVVTE